MYFPPTISFFPSFHPNIFLLLLHHSIINSNYFLILFYDVANDWQPRHLLQLSVYINPTPHSHLFQFSFSSSQDEKSLTTLCLLFFDFPFLLFGNWRRKCQSIWLQKRWLWWDMRVWGKEEGIRRIFNVIFYCINIIKIKNHIKTTQPPPIPLVKKGLYSYSKKQLDFICNFYKSFFFTFT